MYGSRLQKLWNSESFLQDPTQFGYTPSATKEDEDTFLALRYLMHMIRAGCIFNQAKLCLSGASKGCVKLWSLGERKELATFSGHSEIIYVLLSLRMTSWELR